MGGVLTLWTEGEPAGVLRVWCGEGAPPSGVIAGPRVDPLAQAGAPSPWGPSRGEDGRGASRLAVRTLSRVLPLQLRPPQRAEAGDVFAWTNDPASVAAAFRGRGVSWDEHIAWFDRRLVDEAHLWFIAVQGGVPVGLLRLDRGADCWSLGFMVEPLLRRRGLAPRLIAAGLARAPAGGPAVIGECRAANTSSAAAMLAAGMVEVEAIQPATRRFRFAVERPRDAATDCPPGA